MEKQPSKYLSDDRGKPSSMRLMCLLSLLAAIWFGHVSIQQSSDTGLYITMSFLLAAFAPKALQKHLEGVKGSGSAAQ